LVRACRFLLLLLLVGGSTRGINGDGKSGLSLVSRQDSRFLVLSETLEGKKSVDTVSTTKELKLPKNKQIRNCWNEITKNKMFFKWFSPRNTLNNLLFTLT